jgi:hypothetical protein
LVLFERFCGGGAIESTRESVDWSKFEFTVTDIGIDILIIRMRSFRGLESGQSILTYILLTGFSIPVSRLRDDAEFERSLDLAWISDRRLLHADCADGPLWRPGESCARAAPSRRHRWCDAGSAVHESS